eukprot:scaffold1904_cov375-Prasinococcus_capsulatus_cf.AAC.6
MGREGLAAAARPRPSSSCGNPHARAPLHQQQQQHLPPAPGPSLLSCPAVERTCGARRGGRPGDGAIRPRREGGRGPRPRRGSDRGRAGATLPLRAGEEDAASDASLGRVRSWPRAPSAGGGAGTSGRLGSAAVAPIAVAPECPHVARGGEELAQTCPGRGAGPAARRRRAALATADVALKAHGRTNLSRKS